MRPWRKVFSKPGILTSDALGSVSDGAFCLYLMLLVAQDDAGCYPWTPAKIRDLVNRPWSGATTAKHLRELVEAELVKTDGAVLTIVDGQGKNGRPRDAREDFYYDETPGILRAVTRQRRASDAPVTRQRRASDAPLEKEKDIEPDHTPLNPPSGDGEGVCVSDPFGSYEGSPASRAPAPRVPVMPMNDDRTPRDRAFTAFRAEYPPNPDGTEWSWYDARKAWQDHVPPGDEVACMAKLALYRASERVRKGYVRAPANWLPGWRGQTEAAPVDRPIQPGERDPRTGAIKLAI